jgi:molecular chaperone GrpE
LELIESVGKAFDPNFHEAMAQQPSEGKEDDEILMEFQRGYILNGRLLRAAKVIVCKN